MEYGKNALGIMRGHKGLEIKERIIEHLETLLKATRAGRDIDRLDLDRKQETVAIIFKNGCIRKVDITADSGMGIIKDVISRL